MAQCTATANRSGKQCKRGAAPGCTVCSKHGASAPQVRAAGQRRLAEQRARAVVGQLGFGPVGDPIEQLELIAGETIALKDVLRRRVEELESIRWRGESEQTRAEVTVYTQLLRDSATILEKVARLGLEDRKVRVREEQAAMLKAALLATLRGAGLEGAALDRAQKELGRHLRVVQGELAQKAEAVAARPAGA